MTGQIYLEMAALFERLLEISMQAGVLILAVMAARLLLRRTPKNIACVLWIMVAVRLLLPINIESSLSLMPNTDAWLESAENRMQSAVTEPGFYGMDPQNTGEKNLQDPEEIHLQHGEEKDLQNAGQPNPQKAGGTALQNTNPQNASGRRNLFFTVLAAVWLGGMTGIWLYGAWGYFRVKRRVREAVILRDNIRLCDRIDSPFLLGYLRPKIYLPFHMEKNTMEHIIAHEQSHIERRDYLSKLAGFLLLSVYWFHPLIWVAYILFCRDLEMACDERVIRNLSVEKKKEYSKTLLFCSIDRRQLLSAPLAFGEIGVKARIRNVLHYRKPGFWVVIGAAVCCLAVGICFLTNSESEKPENNGDSGSLSADPVEHGDLLSVEGSGRPPVAESVPIEGSGYEELIAGLEEGTAYALIDLGGHIGKVLLVSEEGSYWDSENKKEESFFAEVYYIMEDTLYDLGYVSGSGTAYPIGYGEDGIYVAGGHYVGRYLPDTESRHLKLEEYASEVFDTEGNATYFVYREGEEKVVEDDTYLRKLVDTYFERDIAAFQTVKAEAMADVVIDPEATITALPMETVAEADLDGDGVTELVQVKALEEGADGRLYASENGLPSIQVNDLMFGKDYLASNGIFGEALDIATYYIFDLDREDPYKEIGVYFDGPSFDPLTCLFRYEDGRLFLLGQFESEPLEDIHSLYMMDSPLDRSSYQEILDTTDRTEILIEAPGDGTVSGRTRLDIIETNYGQGLWRLDENSTVSGGHLVWEEKERYLIGQWERGEMTLTTAQEVQLYENLTLGAQVITVPAGEKVALYSYQPQGRWVELAYGDVEALAKGELNDDVSFGWFQWDPAEWEIIMPSGRFPIDEVFDNLSYAD